MISNFGAKDHVKSYKYVTFGGRGGSSAAEGKAISPTQFPGGNVQEDADKQVYAPVLLWSLFTSFVTSIAGVLDTKGGEDFVAFMGDIPSIPYYTVEAFPKFSQSEIYQVLLGPNPLPEEYYSIMTDFYLPAYYKNVVIDATMSNANLQQMYSDTAKAFPTVEPETMGPTSSPTPEPKDETNDGLIIGIAIGTICFLGFFFLAVVAVAKTAAPGTAASAV